MSLDLSSIDRKSHTSSVIVRDYQDSPSGGADQVLNNTGSLPPDNPPTQIEAVCIAGNFEPFEYTLTGLNDGERVLRFETNDKRSRSGGTIHSSFDGRRRRRFDEGNVIRIWNRCAHGHGMHRSVCGRTLD